MFHFRVRPTPLTPSERLAILHNALRGQLIAQASAESMRGAFFEKCAGIAHDAGLFERANEFNAKAVRAFTIAEHLSRAIESSHV